MWRETRGLQKPFADRTIGLTGNAFIAIGFDYGVYGVTIATLGPLRGGVVMILTSFILDLALIKLYDRSKTDWLGLETLKDIRENVGESRLEKFLQWLMQKGDAVVLTVLSFKLNPFNVMLYMRHGAYQYNGMSKRDWKILISSTLIGNLYWILVMYLATSEIKHLWGAFTKG